MIRGLGRAKRLPAVPPQRIMAAADIPIPTQMVDTRADVLHDVVDRHAGVGHAPGRVDVELDVLLGVLGLEEEHLGDDQVGHLVVDLLAQEDDALAQQLRVDVEGPVAPVALLDHGGDEDLFKGWGRSRSASWSWLVWG